MTLHIDEELANYDYVYESILEHSLDHGERPSKISFTRKAFDHVVQSLVLETFIYPEGGFSSFMGIPVEIK